MRYPPLGEEGQRTAWQEAARWSAVAAHSEAFWPIRSCGRVLGPCESSIATSSNLANLHRQILFDEDDVAAGLPKAVAAAEKLRRVNSAIEIEPIVADIDPTNIERFCEGVDVMVDGTDNFETRFLMNDAAVRRGLPWVYGGCVGAQGQTMTILPGKTACLRCLLPQCPLPGSTPTCDTAGVLGPIVGVVASLEAVEAIKILSGNQAAVSRTLTAVDLWQNRFSQIDAVKLHKNADCPACKRREFPWLSGQQGSRTAVLCGRNAVQLSHPGRPPPWTNWPRAWRAWAGSLVTSFSCDWC